MINMQNQIPKNWQKVKLGDYVDITSSKRIFAHEYLNDGIPFYRGKEIIEKFNGNEVSTDLFISPQKFKDIESRFGIPQAGDMLLTSVGTLGIPYLVGKDEKFYFKDGNLTWFRKFKDLDNRFLYLWIQSALGKAQLIKHTIGSSQQALTIDGLKKVEIDLPPKDEQEKISSILSAFDDKIEVNNKIAKTLEEMAQALFKEWFVKFRFPGHEKVKMIESGTAYGMIPEEWEVRKLGDKLNILKGKNITKNTKIHGKVPVVAGGLNPAYYHNKANAQSPVITISASGANSGFVNLYQEDVWVSDCSYIDRKTTSFVYFYYLFLKNKQIEITGLQRGSAQPHVYPKDLMQLTIIDIPEVLINAFEQKVELMFDALKNLKNQNQCLRKTRDLLLPKLMKGEIRV